jgi:hypothetical protein
MNYNEIKENKALVQEANHERRETNHHPGPVGIQ